MSDLACWAKAVFQQDQVGVPGMKYEAMIFLHPADASSSAASVSGLAEMLIDHFVTRRPELPAMFGSRFSPAI